VSDNFQTVFQVNGKTHTNVFPDDGGNLCSLVLQGHIDVSRARKFEIGDLTPYTDGLKFIFKDGFDPAGEFGDGKYLFRHERFLRNKLLGIVFDKLGISIEWF
jgi:hypothetical protein